MLTTPVHKRGLGMIVEDTLNAENSSAVTYIGFERRHGLPIAR